ncbi:collagen alpha-1(XII) chain-like [Thunnus maccoyii]|uniref:collagen alpha-1(XII) chain-like n=1 Tax=Thunnus maccoyii TaxID=8240 RepID=UPI001C4C9881|nr:collagen alpha-1(XII) chain-like [Thunnus maccoyii]
MNFLIFSAGLQAEDKHQSTGSQCESTAKADIVLFVDIYEFNSFEDRSIMRSFLTQIVSNFDIGPDKVQIGLVQDGLSLKTEWQLDTPQTKQSLLEAIAKLHWEGRLRLTYTGKALKYILHNSFKCSEGRRADSQKIAILITDRKSQDDPFLTSQHLRDSGIEVYAIGVKKADETQLRAVASDPDETHMYSVSDFSFLLDIIDKLTINLCNSVNGLGFVRLVNGNSRCSGRLESLSGWWEELVAVQGLWSIKLNIFLHHGAHLLSLNPRPSNSQNSLHSSGQQQELQGGNPLALRGELQHSRTLQEALEYPHTCPTPLTLSNSRKEESSPSPGVWFQSRCCV